MTFEVRPFEAKTASWWYSNRESIDFEPPYQRTGPAWGVDRQAFLIDTIINDFDMPKLYLADFTYFQSDLNTANKRFAIIDGKQRLSAIFNFLDDNLPLAPDFVFRADPDAPLAGLKYSEMNSKFPELRLKVDNFNLPVMSVISDEVSMVNELFVRLNSGKPLTSAERRNAMNGIVPGLVREITSSTFFTECVSFPSLGRSHDQAATKLLLLESSGRPVDLKKKQLDDLFRSGEDGNENSAALRSATDTVMETLRVMADTFQSRDPLLRTQGQIPVYYLVFRGADTQPPTRDSIKLFHETRAEVREVDHLAEPSRRLSAQIDNRTFAAVLEYNKLMRNPNDAKSVYQMADILSSFTTYHG